MGKKSGSLTEKQVVEKTITLELTDEELDNLYNSIKEEGIKITDEDSSDATAKEVVKESTLTFTDVLKDLIETGKKDGFLTYETIAKKTTKGALIASPLISSCSTVCLLCFLCTSICSLLGTD